MATGRTETDMGTGLALSFGALAGVAALASTATAYLYALDGAQAMQLASGIAIAAAFLFGGLAVAVLHRYG
ncbi:MAG: hypothetical protein ABEH64_04860 [Salinirussus sp.]